MTSTAQVENSPNLEISADTSQEDSDSTFSVDELRVYPTQRRGFNSDEFRELERQLGMETSSEETVHINNKTPSNNNVEFASSSSLLGPVSPGAIERTRETIYRIIDSVFICMLLGILMVADFLSCVIFFWMLVHAKTPSKFFVFCRIVDWITAVSFGVEVNARLVSYGVAFYFHSTIRGLEYLISMFNLFMVVVCSVINTQWLPIIRFIRVLRSLFSALRWRERYINWFTRSELANMAHLLEMERDSKLKNWQINSSCITIGQRAGAGGFGIVFSGLFRGTLVAIKQFLHPENIGNSGTIEYEASVLVNLRHPNVILFMGLVKEPGLLWVITEFCTRGSLRDVLDSNIPLSQARILKFALGAARGLAYLHGQSTPVLHLDLKSSNILISSGWEAKLGDFGLSRTLNNAFGAHFSGTVQYSAPEVLKACQFSMAADVYSFGICMWEMMAREAPGQGLQPLRLAVEIIENGWRPPTDNFVAYQRAFAHTGPKRDAGGKRRMPLSISKIDRNPLLRDKLGKLSSENRLSKSKASSYSSGPDCCATPYKQIHVRCELPYLKDVSSLGRKKNCEECLQKLKISPDDDKGRISVIVHKENDDRMNASQGAERQRHSGREPTGVRTGICSTFGDWRLSRCARSGSVARLSNMLQKLSRTSDRVCVCTEGGPRRSNLDGLSEMVRGVMHRLDDRPPVGRKLDHTPSHTAVETRNDALKHRTQRSNETLRLAQCSSDVESKNLEKRFSEQNDKNVESKMVIKEEELKEELERMESKVTDRCGGGQCETTEGNERNVLVPQDFMDLMTQCWAQDVSQRPSAGELVWRLIILMDEERRARDI